jgi:PAS domain S-box-containing protein
MMLDYERELSLIRDLLKKNPKGMSVTDISKALNKNKNTVGRYLDILLISGQVDMRTHGMAKVFTLSQRVPLSAMLSYSKELIMVLDDESRIVDLNDNLLKLLNLSRPETMGKNVAYLNPPDVDVHELLELLTSGNTEQEGAITFRLKNESERIFIQKSVPTVFENGKKGRTIILEDITEHILADREIRKSEERFRLMAETIQDGIIILENDSTVYVNGRIAAISGYSYEELQKMNPLSIVAPEDRQLAADQIRMMETGYVGPGKLEMWIVRKDGERRFVYGRVTTTADAVTRYTFIIFTDITELKSKEAALLQSEQRFRMMVENIHEGLIIVENGQFVFANQRISAITGYSLEELKEMKPPDLISREDSKNIGFLITHDSPGSEDSREITFWINRKDGNRRCILGRITTALRNTVVSSYITMTDITETTEREKELRDRITELQHLIG